MELKAARALALHDFTSRSPTYWLGRLLSTKARVKNDPRQITMLCDVSTLNCFMRSTSLLERRQDDAGLTTCYLT